MSDLVKDIANLSVEKRELLLQRLRQKKENTSRTKITSQSRDSNIFPLSFAQQRLWFFEQFEPGNRFYNQPVAVRLTGALNLDVLEQSFNEIIRRHEALRTTFSTVEGQPIQVIAPTLALKLPVVDLQKLPDADREKEVLHVATKEAQMPFNLVEGPLLRCTLLQLDQAEYVLLFTMHHIISDGWSKGILIREMATLYEAFSTGQLSPLAELPIQYADFAVWQRQWLQAEVLQSQISYWQKQLEGAPTILELPTDHPRPAVQTFLGATYSFELSIDLLQALKKLSQNQGTTLFMTLLAAFQTLLWRYTGQEDIVVGSPIANRNSADIEGLIGFFVNTLVLRTNLASNPTFGELLTRVREVALGAYAHQDLPFEKLVDELQPQRSLSYTPLFQVMFALQNAPMSALELPGLSLSLLASESDSTKFDLTLLMTETAQGLVGSLEYNTDLFESSTISRMAEHLQTLLSGIVADPQQRLSELTLLTQADKALLVQWNDTSVEYPQYQCIHQLFEAQVEHTPDAVAVVFEDEQLTYCELNARANQLAHYLRSLGVGPEILVGICTERSLDMIIGLLAILKAGGAYVPLDPGYPQERFDFILQDAQVPVLLTQQRLMENLPESQTRTVCLDTDWGSIAKECEQNLISNCTTDNLAYIIYTSGSTGQPKGVLVNHANVVRLLAATQSWYHFNQQDIFSLFHSYAFDFSVWELWGALLYGGQLVVVPYWLSRSPEDFYKLLSAQQVTVLNQTPSAFRQLIEVEETLGGTNKLNLRLVIFGGEALELQSLKPWFGRHGDQFPQLVNMYGITETTVHVTYRPLTMADLEAACGSVIGRPIPDLQVYLLDQYGQPVPIGVHGEMYIGGSGVARGYLNRPELTGEKFISNPFSDKPNARFYKSGDKARYLPNGDIEYLGRIDNQVKVRGFRIELGEIENALAKHHAVRETVVLAREIQLGNKQLVAYVVLHKEQTPATSDLRNFLIQQLPEYMVPAAFVILEALPLTHNGKIDHRALPAPDNARPELEEVFVAPRTSEEKILAEVWAKVLDLEQVGIHDNFFSLGGDSIRSIQVQSQVQKHGLNFSIQQLFQHQTIHELAKTFTTAKHSNANTKLVEPFSLLSEADRQKLPDKLEDAYPLSQLQAGMLFHSIYSPDTAIFHNVTSHHLKAPFDLQKLQIAIQELADCHAVLRTSFALGNYSEPIQFVHKTVSIPLQVEDLRHLCATEQEKVLAVWFDAEKSKKFDWTYPPLLRFQIHRRSEETFQFSFTEHHAILDGWSVASMITELFGRYLFLLGEKFSLPDLSLAIAYRDFIALERQALASDECQRFWSKKLNNSTIITLPRWSKIGQVANNVRSVGVHQVELSLEVSLGLIQLAQFAGVPLKSILLAAHLRVLSLLSGQPDVLTGLVSNGRSEEADGERVLGLFLNTLPFRLQLSAETWIDLVQKTFNAERELLPYRRYPLAELQRRLGQQPLFETAFNFTNFHVYKNIQGLNNAQLLSSKSFAEADFTLFTQFSLDSSLSRIHLAVEYDAREFGPEQIAAISGYYARILAAIALEPKRRYESISLLCPLEQHQLLVEWNDTQIDYPQERCIDKLFQAQVERTPDAVAVVFEDEQLTYCELNARANQLAHYLRSLGVKPEVLVGICVERSLSMVMGLLGILKAGGAYVPLDPTYPKQRLAFMLEDAQLPVLLTQQGLVEKLPEHEAQVVCLDTDSHIITQQSQGNPVSISEADNLAYIIYTSGSTGQPKGVFGLHRGAVNRFHWMWQNYPFIEREICCHKTSLNFVDSVWEIFGPLLQGMPTVIVPDSVLKDPQELVAALASNNVTRLVLVPSLLHVLLETYSDLQLQLPQLKLWVSSGEPLSIDLLQQFRQSLPDSTLLNLYGSSEVSADVTCYSLSPHEPLPDRVLIGRPIANIQIYVLDANKLPVPVGVTGELHIGGDGLARGYLNRPELTAEKFIPNPFENSKSPKFRSPPSGDLTSLKIQNSKWNRLYKTGDLARYLPNGEIEYLGRIDHQVKVRGFRIELGEIEAHLRQHPKVRETVVVVRSDSDDSQRIVAYVVPQKEQTLTITELRDFLESKLPNYIVPTAFVMLEALPLTPNGKVDRKVLPAPDTTRPELEAVYQPPQTEVEQTIAKIWLEVLHVDNVGIHDNFFELGGHSLLLLQVHSKFCKVFERDLSVLEMFRYPTISSLAEFLNQANKNQILFNQISDRTVQLEDGKTRTKQFLRISKISKKIK